MANVIWTAAASPTRRRFGTPAGSGTFRASGAFQSAVAAAALPAQSKIAPVFGRLVTSRIGRVSVLDCASPLALSITHDCRSARALAHAMTWRQHVRFMGEKRRLLYPVVLKLNELR